MDVVNSAGAGISWW